MTQINENTNTASASVTPSNSLRKWHYGKKKWIVGGVIALAAIGFTFGSRHHHGHGGPRGEMSAAQILERTDHMVERLAKKVDATPEQSAKLKQIAEAASADIAPVRAQMKETRTQLLQIMQAPAIDRAALEQLRNAQVAQMDAVSKRMSQSLADAGDVLTPEQRMKLAQKWQY